MAAMLAIGLWRGLRTGALRQIVSTVGWVVGFVFATALMEPIGVIVAESLGVSPRTAPVLGFIVVFGAVLAALTAATHVLRKTLEAIKLGSLDTAAGGGVGALRAAFGLSVLMLTTSFSPLPGQSPFAIAEETRAGSVLYDPIEAIAPEVWGVVRAVTPGMQQALVDKFNTWQEGEPESVTGEEPLD
ncbi:CvpA family protein [Rubrivirga sp.]|uniref:CvpA family protein n=1 Tax=Rubrivirga sp. TaxID=1885344 RepID=UPI003C762DE6